MKIAILGNGKEGQAIRKYFENHGDKCTNFENFTDAELQNFDLSEYDQVFRSPSVKPLDKNWQSATKFFFEKCPAKIIGVTGTKGKGTTCSLIESVLKSLGKKVWLVGNIGNPAISVLDQIGPDDVVVYEMSSFQLWDLEKSPKISVVLPIEPDHLNVHKDFDDYVSAKANIARWQSADDVCIFNINNEFSVKIAEESAARKLGYPVEAWAKLNNALDSLTIIGQHNRENAEAALLAVAAYLKEPLDDLLDNKFTELCAGLKDFRGLPHRLEFLKEIEGVKYYDDNFATNVASTRVAMEALKDKSLVMIVGGRDKTDNEDLPELYDLLNAENVKKVVLIGESGHELFNKYSSEKFVLAESLEDAVTKSRELANAHQADTVLMSPAAASFDMFENVYDRGDQFAKLIQDLK